MRATVVALVAMLAVLAPLAIAAGPPTASTGKTFVGAFSGVQTRTFLGQAAGGSGGYSFHWRQTGGPQADMHGAESSIVSVDFHSAGAYSFLFTVRDSSGQEASSTVLAFLADAGTMPEVPVGKDIEVRLPQTAVRLVAPDASASTTYSWAVKSGQAGLTKDGANSPAFTVSDLMPGSYVFELTTRDSAAGTSRRTVNLYVRQAENALPSVQAPAEVSVYAPASGTEIAATAWDNDGSVFSYQWKQETGPTTLELTNVNAPNLQILGGLVVGEYKLALTVTDDDGGVTTEYTRVVVKREPEAPTLSLVPPVQTVQLPVPGGVSFAAVVGNADPSRVALSWKVAQGSPLRLTSRGLNVTCSEILHPGTYVIAAMMPGPQGSTITATATLVVEAPAASQAVAHVMLPVKGELALSAAGGAHTGDMLFHWEQVDGPAQVTLLGGSSPRVVLSGLNKDGVYVFRCSVSNSIGQAAVTVVTLYASFPPKLVDGADGEGARKVEIPYEDVTVEITPQGERRLSFRPMSMTLRADASNVVWPNTKLTWVQSAGPELAPKQVSGNDTSELTLQNLLPGSYVIDAVAYSDSIKARLERPVSFTVNVVPRAIVPADVTLTAPNSSLVLSGSADDLGGSIVSYKWELVEGPASGSSRMSGVNTATLALRDLEPGAYRFRLRVVDDLGGVGTQTVAVTIHPAPEAPPAPPPKLVETPAPETPSPSPSPSPTPVPPPTEVVARGLPISSVSAGGRTVVAVEGDASATLRATVVAEDPSQVRYMWAQVAGPNEAELAGDSTSELTVSNLKMGTYAFKVVASVGAAAAEDTATLVVSSTPSLSVSSASAVALSGDEATVSARAFSADGSPITYKWAQADSNPALILLPDADGTVRVRGAGPYAYDLAVTATNEAGISTTATHRLLVEGDPWYRKLGLWASLGSLAALGCYAVASGLGFPGGYPLTYTNHLQFVGSLLFVRADFALPAWEYAKAFGWSLLHFAPPATIAATGAVSAPNAYIARRLLQVVESDPMGLVVPAQAAVPARQYVDGNLLWSLVALAVAFVLHVVFFVICNVARKGKGLPSSLTFPKVEHFVLHFLYAGLCLNACSLVNAVRSGQATHLAIGVRAVLLVVLVIYALVVLFRPMTGAKSLLHYNDPARMGPESDKRPFMSLEAGGRSDSAIHSTPTLDPSLGLWRTQGSLASEQYANHWTYFFKRFGGERGGYLFIGLEHVEKLARAFILGAFLLSDGPAAARFQVGALVVMAVAKIIHLAIARPFAVDRVETFIQIIIAVLEAIIAGVVALFIGGTDFQRRALLALPSAATGAKAFVGLSAAALVLALFDSVRVLLAAVARTIVGPKSARRGLQTRPSFDSGKVLDVKRKNEVARREHNAAVSASLRSLPGDPKRLRPEERADWLFKTALHVPQLARTFNVFVPDRAPAPFQQRFAGLTKTLERGYLVDVDPANGNVFFWFDTSRPAAVVHSDWCKRRVHKLLNRRKQEMLDAGDFVTGETTFWDDPDVSLVAAREECFPEFGTTGKERFPQYSMAEYAREICAPNGDYQEGIWRGYGFELVGFEFDLPIKPVYFGSARIAATLDRACNVAKTAAPNFLRVYDFFALRNFSETNRNHIRVVSVVEPTDMDLESFLGGIRVAAYPNEFEELMRATLLQIVTAIHSAQNTSFDGKALNFRHNDLSPSNVAVSISEALRRRLDTLAMTPPNDRRPLADLERAPENTDPTVRRYVFYEVAERYLVGPGGGPSPSPATLGAGISAGDAVDHEGRQYLPGAQFAVDLHRAPLAKIVNFAKSACRVLDSKGRLRDDPVRGHECPRVLHSESYDLKYLAVRLWITLERFRENLGPCPPGLADVLSYMAGTDLSHIAHQFRDPSVTIDITDNFVALPRSILDHPFFAPLRSAPRNAPPPTIANTYYYVEHPHDRPVPAASL
eukprot:tig00021339_g20446.t1